MDKNILNENIEELYLDKEKILGETYNRSLPFQDAMFDRWERALRLGFGDGASIYNSSIVFGDIKVGENTWIGPYTLLDGSEGLEIGNYCSISAGVHIYSHDTVLWALSGGKAEKRSGAVVIGDCCYIGSQSIIAFGTTIGHHSVVAANSFINCNIPPYSIFGGNPGKKIGTVVEDHGAIELVYSQEPSSGSLE